MTKRIQVTLSDEQFTNLWNRSVREIHFPRENPRRAWTDRERREIISMWLIWKAES